MFNKRKLPKPAKQQLIIKKLQESPKRQIELSQELQIPKTTIFDLLVELETQGIVKREVIRENRRGRPKVRWVLQY